MNKQLNSLKLSQKSEVLNDFQDVIDKINIDPNDVLKSVMNDTTFCAWTDEIRNPLLMT